MVDISNITPQDFKLTRVQSIKTENEESNENIFIIGMYFHW